MADGTFLNSLGLDVSLLTAGSLGGLVKSIVDRSRPIEAVGAMVAGAVLSNYFSDSVVELAGGGILFGFKFAMKPGVAGCFIGGFSFALFGFAGAWLRGRLSTPSKP